MDRDEAKKKLEQLFAEVFEKNPVEFHLRKMEGLDMHVEWDDDKALDYFEELKRILK